MDRELEKELKSLIGERKICETEMKTHQTQISQMLNGYMGQDMKDVLSGKKTIKLSWKQKIKYKIDNFLKFLNDYEY